MKIKGKNQKDQKDFFFPSVSWQINYSFGEIQQNNKFVPISIVSERQFSI